MPQGGRLLPRRAPLLRRLALPRAPASPRDRPTYASGVLRFEASIFFPPHKDVELTNSLTSFEREKRRWGKRWPRESHPPKVHRSTPVPTWCQENEAPFFSRTFALRLFNQHTSYYVLRQCPGYQVWFHTRNKCHNIFQVARDPNRVSDFDVFGSATGCVSELASYYVVGTFRVW